MNAIKEKISFILFRKINWFQILSVSGPNLKQFHL